MISRHSACFLGLLALASVQCFGGASDLKATVDDRRPKSAYFDGHTHWPNGILPWKAYAKMLEAYQSPEDQAILDKTVPTQQEYARLVEIYTALFEQIKTHLNTPKSAADPEGLQDSPRVHPASRAVADIELIRPDLDANGLDRNGTKRLQQLEIALRRLLTSSVRTDYDSAYAVRGSIYDAFLRGPHSAARKAKVLDWLLRETAKGKVTYSEQSASLNSVTQDFTPEKMGASLARIAPGLNEAAPDVHFLIQFTTQWLAQVSATQWQKSAETGLVRVTDPRAIDANEKLFQTLTGAKSPLGQGNVSGVDILSPEKNAFSTMGQGNFKKLVLGLYQKSRELRKRLLVHAHCGEGYPIAPEHGTTPESLDAPVPAVAMGANGEPLYYQYAEANVEKLLEVVEQIRADMTPEELARFDDHIVIRFGHVSHASLDQARRMAAAKIWADINLTSNIATGTLYLDRPDLNTPNTLNYFRDHALVDLMAENVKVVFGTDGPGVEHSAMPNEVAIAEDLLKKVEAKVKDRAGAVMKDNARNYVNRMLGNAVEHAAFMAGKPR